MSISEYRESYHLRCSKQQAVTLLHDLQLPGFVLPESGGWSPVFVEGAPFTDNSVLSQLRRTWVLHFFEIREGMWTLRLFCNRGLVAEIIGHPHQQTIGKLWESPANLLDAPEVSDAERELLSRLRPGTDGPVACDLEEVVTFLGLPEGWLSYEKIGQWPDWQERLPAGSEQVLPVRTKHRPSFRLPAVSEIEFPSVGFGNHRDVRAAVKPLISQATKTNSWEHLRTAPRQTFTSLGQDIMLAEGLYMYKQDSLAWRPYCVVDAFVETARRRKYDFPKRVGRLQPLVELAHDDFWIALGLLGGMHDLSNAMPQLGREAYLAMLGALVRWIPEIEAISAHFVDTMAVDAHRRFPFWSRGMISAAYLAGWKLEPLRLEAEFAGDWLVALLETEVVQLSGERFEVTERFAGQ